MVKNGKILVCDRCGKAVFIEPDVDDFDIPDGWLAVQGMDVCPSCGSEYGRIMREFWGDLGKKQIKF